MSSLIFLVVVPIICAGICFSIATKRKANVPFWVVMGAIFSILALPFVFFSKPKH